MTCQPDALIGDHVQPGRATPPAEVARVRAGVDRADRDDEAHPVYRGDQPAAPRLGQLDAGLRLDEDLVRGGVSVRAQVVLIDMGEAGPAQRGTAVVDDRSEANVERVRAQRRRHRDVQVGQAGGAAGCRAKRVQEARLPAQHVQDQLRQVHRRQHCLQPTTQVRQARRVRDRVELGGVQAAVGVHGDGLCRVPPSGIQLAGCLVQQRRRVVG